MKHFILLKLAVLSFGAAAALVLTPACKAQSEISPDHFDGTDSWAMAAQPKHVQPQRPADTRPSLQAISSKETKGSSFQLAAAREAAKPVRREAVVADRQRKSTTPNKP